MSEEKILVRYEADTDSYVEQIDKVIEANKRLQDEMNKLNDIEIKLKITQDT